MTDQEGLIKLLNDPQLRTLAPPAALPVRSAETDAEAVGSASTDWTADSVPVKLEKIRSVLLNAKTAGDILAEAEMMTVGQWLDLVVRMMPKDVKVTGSVDFKHMLSDLGPIDKDSYRLGQRSGDGLVIEAVPCDTK